MQQVGARALNQDLDLKANYKTKKGCKEQRAVRVAWCAAEWKAVQATIARGMPDNLVPYSLASAERHVPMITWTGK